MLKKTLSLWSLLLCLGISIFLLKDELIFQSRPKDLSYWYCPVCSGQTLMESQHPQALSLKEEIAQRQSNHEALETIYDDIFSRYQSYSPRYELSLKVLALGLVIYQMREYLNKKGDSVE